MPFSRNLIVYTSDGDANGAAVGNYPVTTTVNNAGNPNFHPLLVTARILTQANILTPATINIGTNSPNFNNIVNGQQLGGVLGMIVLPLAQGAAPVPLNTPIVVRVSVAAGPVPLTVATLTFRVTLLGFDVEF